MHPRFDSSPDRKKTPTFGISLVATILALTSSLWIGACGAKGPGRGPGSGEATASEPKAVAPADRVAKTGVTGNDAREERERDEEDSDANVALPVAPAAGGDNAPRIWFETLLTTPYLPKMALACEPLPDGSGFFILSRDGDLWFYDKALEDLPFSDRHARSAQKGQPWAGGGLMVKLDDVAAQKDIGSIGMALDPDFLENRHVWVWRCDVGDKSVGLDRLTWNGDAAAIRKSLVHTLRFSRKEPPKPYHMGGILQFLPDKSLLIAVGDAERQELSQDPRDLNGKLLRIMPGRGDQTGYTIPDDNPHVGDPAFLPEIVAMGFRAPFRGYWHKPGRFYIADVGAEHEEIDLWTGGAADFGWGHGLNTDGPDVPAGVTPPLVWWNVDQDWSKEDPEYRGETRVAAGVAFVYESPKDRYHGQLTGRLLFYDIKRGWIRSAGLGDRGEILEHRHVGHFENNAQMLVGRDGYVYAVAYSGPPRLVRMRLD